MSMIDQSTIGVACNEGEEPWVREFFELFKVPWEFYRKGRTYAAVVTTHGDLEDFHAKLIVRYSSKGPWEHLLNHLEVFVDYESFVLPIYGNARKFESTNPPLARLHGSVSAVATQEQRANLTIVHAGYDLFEEVRILLSSGQPARNALTPTLEIHISMLRNWIVCAGVPLIEIPAAPGGYDFIACLTHDVDFVRISDHKFDHTMLGFLYRSSIGSILDLAKKKITWRQCMKNLTALISLPAVYLGIKEDFWLQDFDRFGSAERGLKATYFFIPFKNRPGEKVARKNAHRRAAMYDVADEQLLVRTLAERGNEIGVHGIDAWHDPDKGREERRKLSRISGEASSGIRMHWLCFDTASPRILEEAGFQYDSTCGYNDTVGYKAGTAQAFRPSGASYLLELPLHIQDTALFYSSYLGCGQAQARKVCDVLLKNAATLGGVLTILWHTRSLAPERQWGDFYLQLLQRIRAHRVWFATAGEAVEWFRRRRAFSFADAELLGWHVRMRMVTDRNVEVADGRSVPDLTLRFYTPREEKNGPWHNERGFVDIPLARDAAVKRAVG